MKHHVAEVVAHRHYPVLTRVLRKTVVLITSLVVIIPDVECKHVARMLTVLRSGRVIKTCGTGVAAECLDVVSLLQSETSV